KARALGMKVLLNDPPLARRTEDASYRPLEELLLCDFVTLHVPLNKGGEDKTYHMADQRFFSSLKTKAIFMNSSRGAVMDTAALKNAIKTGRLAACVLDVWENEPNIDAELLSLVDIATPHIAGYSYDGKVAGMIMIYEALCRHFGLKATHSMDDFLPAPAVKTIEIDGGPADEQTIIHSATRRLYDIMADDRDMRGMLRIEPQNRGAYFDRLRKEYPVRREFQNTRIVLKNSSDVLAARLTGIGFKV
ncbi:MAG TPA: DUF3410 domain-containing protein, partial [Sedimentisphaerales bacterium]|nr:DUF3410 domain-containing protein [Sedimentisphaerales bacterium]